MSKINIKRAKALANVVMALSSEVGATSPTALSLSPFWHYHYSILSKVHADISSCTTFEDQMLEMLAPYIPPFASDIYVLQSDFTPSVKAYSPTLAERGYIWTPNNPIKGNKPINIGYKRSYVNLSAASDWSLPLSTQRVGLTEGDMDVSAQQLNSLLSNASLPFKNASLVINTADSSYTVPHYIYPTLEENAQLVQITRFRSGLKVYTPYQGSSAKQKYGDITYYLQENAERKCYNPQTKAHFVKDQIPVFELEATEQTCFEITTKRGRRCLVTLWRFNDLLIRGTRECPMHEHFFDLVVSQVTDVLTGELVFKNNSYVGAWGAQRKMLSTKQIYVHYRQRYDIEPHNRFSKQTLLLDKYQTPDVDHLDAWAKVVALAYWLLFLASNRTEIVVNEWEKYLPEMKKTQKKQDESSAYRDRKSPSMTRRGIKKLLLSFDQKPFMPQDSKGGKGRKKGDTQTKRGRHPPKKKEKIKLKTEKIE